MVFVVIAMFVLEMASCGRSWWVCVGCVSGDMFDSEMVSGSGGSGGSDDSYVCFGDDERWLVVGGDCQVVEMVSGGR